MTNTTLDGSGTPFVIPAGSTQQVNDGDAVFLLGTITNRGTLALNGTGTLSGPPTLSQLAQIVLASPTVTLTGGGTLAMTATSPSRLWGSSDTGETLVNADNTIIGAGVIGIADARTIDASTTVYPIALVNGTGGVIDANGTIASSGTSQATFIPAQNLVISTGSLRLANAGLIEATGIGGLVIQSNAIDQSGGGTILSRGAGVIVTLTSNNYVAGVGWAGIDIIGGTLDATGGGAFQFDANGTGGTLDGRTSPVTLGAGVDITGGIRYLLGTIDNHGTIAVAGTVYPHNNIFFASPTITLTGGGTVVDPIFTDAAGSLDILVNVDNTISGTGMIGIAFVDNSSYGPFLGSAPIGLTNEAAGVINANGASGFGLSLFSGGAALRNDGLMQATGAGGLQITNVTLDQSGGGTLQAIGAGAIVTLQTVDVIGGLLASSGGGIIKFNGQQHAHQQWRADHLRRWHCRGHQRPRLQHNRHADAAFGGAGQFRHIDRGQHADPGQPGHDSGRRRHGAGQRGRRRHQHRRCHRLDQFRQYPDRQRKHHVGHACADQCRCWRDQRHHH